MFSTRLASLRTLTLPRSVSMTTYIIPPTVLYIKQHSITGLKYFGKTTQDPYKYNGSGKHWAPHIKKHGRKHIITTNVFGPFTNSIAISEFALAFSKDHNIVNSDLWANQKPENGIDGGVPGIKRGPSGRKGIPNGRKGIPNGRKGISTGPRGKQRNPNRKQRNPSPLKGKPNGRKGIPTGPSPQKGKPTGKQKNPALKVECPHCGKIGNRNMTRDHFDNCKMKPLF